VSPLSHRFQYLTNIAAALLFALGVTLAALSWFDLIGYHHFVLSWRNL
jgi:hypothetical protein